MNKLSIVFAGALLMAASCANNSNKCDCNCSCPGCTCNQDKPADKAKLDYRVVDNKNVDISKFPVDKDGYIVLFDGKTLSTAGAAMAWTRLPRAGLSRTVQSS